jgi:autotransporter-associated beta strand protein
MKPKGLAKTLLGTSALTAVAVSFGIPSALAASDTWDNGGGDNLWQTVTNWASDATFPGTVGNVFTSTDVATFSTTGAGGTIDLGGTLNVLNLTFGVSGGDAASFSIADATDTLNFTTAGGITINSGVTTAQTIGASGTTINLSDAAAASTTFTNNGTGLLTIAGNIAAQNVSGAGVLTVGGTGNTTITGTITEPGVGNNALKKIGSGTLTLTNGSAWSGAGAVQTAFSGPFTVQEGTLLLNGGAHAVTGEAVIGGVVTHGGAGQNAKIQVDAGSLAISSWLSIGRGNGVGGASSDLELNNAAIVTSGDFSAGFNAGNAANLPKGTITLNDTSSLTVTTNVNFAESAGSNFTMNINDSASFVQTNTGGGQTRLGGGNGAVGVINVNGGTLSSERDLILGYGGTGSGKLVLNSGTVNVASATERWLIIGQNNTASGELTVNGGTLNLNANTDIRFSTSGTAAGTSVVNLNGGSIVGGISSVVDLKQNTNAGANNTFNLNGGTLTIAQVLTSNDTGTAAFNFNGGVLRATVTTADFINLGGALQRTNVRNGGATIDTNSFDVTVAEALLHSNIGGDNATDGGLTKTGVGTLTVTNAANTYTGGTTISNGTLATGLTGNLGTGNVTVADSFTAALTLGNGSSIADTAILLFGDDATITLDNGTTETLAGVTQTDDSQSIGAGIYTAGDLNTFFGVSSFLGEGTLTVVPEPSAALLGGLGVLGLLRRRRNA